jgi:ABC-type transport system involved in cytochrome bd biosynthesis fused ATPase/permease subunit
MAGNDTCAKVPSALKELDNKTSEAITTLLRSQTHGLNSDKKIDVKFQELNVIAPAQLQSQVKTLPRAILNTFGVDQYNFFKSFLLPKFRTVEERYENSKTILKNISGHVRPGEMLFVLGRPGSGCSTFLRTIANSTTLSVTGEVSYANIPQRQFSTEHPRETIYLPEEDRHIAALTVRQTIQFALRATLPTSIRTPALVNELVAGIAKLLGLEHTLDSPVGGQFSPGVSGGERKRQVVCCFK